MVGAITRPRRRAAAPIDRASVRVEIARTGGGSTVVGDADAAVRDPRLSAAERRAVGAVVEAVRLLRTRGHMRGIDDAGSAVRLVLRDESATRRGPWATNGRISIGERSGLVRGFGDEDRVDPDVLLPVDTAFHELVHTVQFARMPPGVDAIHPAIGEGIADAAAMLATGDRALGEGYYRRGPHGPMGSIRELGPRRLSGPPLGPTITDLRLATLPGVESHAAGGVVAATFDAVARRLGRRRGEALLWAVIHDPAAWHGGGSWRQLAASIMHCSAGLWPADARARGAVQAALGATHLRDALMPVARG